MKVEARLEGVQILVLLNGETKAGIRRRIGK